MMGGFILEFGSGIAGYAIFVPYNRRHRVNMMAKPIEPSGSGAPPSREWKKGDKFVIPSIGRGEVITPGPTLTKVKIGDDVPCKVPTGSLQDLPTKASVVPRKGRRRGRYDYGVHGFNFQ